MTRTTLAALAAIAVAGVLAFLVNPEGSAAEACAAPSPTVQFSCN
ncbi:hypothetical protein [Hyphomonas sp. UBA4494]|nr:hypothetical protein [Hyphomonas sp. UBA4494]